METSFIRSSHPILSCADAAAWEAKLIATEDEAWWAMCKAGASLGQALRYDFGMTREKQRAVNVLGLIGKGHNGGDALLAIAELVGMADFIGSITLIFPSPLADLKMNTRRAFDQLESSVELFTIAPQGDDSAAWLRQVGQTLGGSCFHICLDGLLGMQFRPPIRSNVAQLIRQVNEHPSIRFRAAVDLPSGVGDASDHAPFRADFSYATGILKRPLLSNECCGCIRYLDIGFFNGANEHPLRVLTEQVLHPVRKLRPPHSEKRMYGHLAILAGSRSMPGALCMCVQSALSSGVGLVTVFAPESIAAQLACFLPEAMWRSWPETPQGGLALEGLHQIRSIAGKASALLLGPGMGSERETQALLCEIAQEWDKPAVLDADALTPELIEAFRESGNRDVIVTPHDGEFARLSGSEDTSDEAVLEFARVKELVLVKKGSSTRISDGQTVFLNTTGNGVLSRGGSGDILAGLIAGLVAQHSGDPLVAACMGVFWHGKAADRLARERGQTAVRTTDLMDFFAPALEDGVVWNSNYPASRRFGH